MSASAREERGLRTGSLLVWALVGLIGVVAFTWPLFVAPSSALSTSSQGPFLFAAVLPLVLALVLSEVSREGMSPRTLAMLGLLSAFGCIARPLGAGVAGLELTFVLVILGGRVFGPRFGFLLGNLTLLASALVTGGVGPWLPYQMLASGAVGAGAGLLPRALSGRAEVASLCGFGAVSAFAYGWLMDLAFWPFTLGVDTSASFVAGAPLLENLHRFVIFNALTSMGWNLGRAISNVVALALLAAPVLRILRRTQR
ncbi:ECF transporter S component [Tessaracoccus sp. OH4464_COT-324]|uniref:ECF transporter S component n=1 Tax=Tessaracoccus sp. OH4464_COT-324 TaxID=2491059 RepID=UPI000F6316FF|nr:ECF transporter S component [Tessaracoccus sp. OH4464_COT-324]RRD45225.1 ECF transporter S component [Tessaracoccus sp. OH4464_COT-324]